MARVNVGVNPQYLSDQHLIAESVEIIMIVNAFKMQNFEVKGKIPEQFCLNTGHINFFKHKLLYLKRRLDVVNIEIHHRGFKVGNDFNLQDFPKQFHGNFLPSTSDAYLIKARIIDRIKKPLKAKSNFHKHHQTQIDVNQFCEALYNSPLNPV